MEQNIIVGLTYLPTEGKVVLVGKADRILDHGKPCWLCSNYPPAKSQFEVVNDIETVDNWLRTVCDAEIIIVGDYSKDIIAN